MRSYVNNGKPYSLESVNNIKRLWCEGETIEAIAIKFMRKNSGILTKLHNLGVVDLTASPYWHRVNQYQWEDVEDEIGSLHYKDSRLGYTQLQDDTLPQGTYAINSNEVTTAPQFTGEYNMTQRKQVKVRVWTDRSDIDHGDALIYESEDFIVTGKDDLKDIRDDILVQEGQVILLTIEKINNNYGFDSDPDLPELSLKDLRWEVVNS